MPVITIDCNGEQYSSHVFKRMLERGISRMVITEVLKNGEIINAYPNDKPYPSKLVLKFIENKPIHVVVSQDEEGKCFIITAYEPNKEIWENDFKSKRK